MRDLIDTFTQRGDLAHLALFLWASSATALLIFSLRELAGAMRRFDDFVRELARFNRNFGGSHGSARQRAPRHSNAAATEARSPDGVSRIPDASRSGRAQDAAACREAQAREAKDEDVERFPI